MRILDEFNRRFAGRTARVWRAGKHPFRECAVLHIKEFRPMLEHEYNPNPMWARRVSWSKDMLCAVIDWDRSEFYDPYRDWSPDQPQEFMPHLMPVVTIGTDYFFKEDRVVGIWNRECVTIMEVIDEKICD